MKATTFHLNLFNRIELKVGRVSHPSPDPQTTRSHRDASASVHNADTIKEPENVIHLKEVGRGVWSGAGDAGGARQKARALRVFEPTGYYNASGKETFLHTPKGELVDFFL